MENNEIVLAEKHEVSENAFANAENFQQLFNIGKMLASSDLVPSNYQNKPMNCVIAIDVANRMKVSPMMVMQNLYVVQGKPSWSGQACMSMIKASSEFKDVKPVYTGERGTDTWGCYIQATRTSDDEVIKGVEVTIKMAKEEGWYGKSGSKWKTMPELMLSYRAAAFFSRVHLPNALMGFSVEGESEDVVREKLPAAPNPMAFEPEEEVIRQASEVFR